MSGSNCSMYGSFQIILQKVHKSAKCVFVKLRKGGEGVKNNTQRGRILRAAYGWQVVLSME